MNSCQNIDPCNPCQADNYNYIRKTVLLLSAVVAGNIDKVGLGPLQKNKTKNSKSDQSRPLSSSYTSTLLYLSPPDFVICNFDWLRNILDRHANNKVYSVQILTSCHAMLGFYDKIFGYATQSLTIL